MYLGRSRLVLGLLCLLLISAFAVAVPVSASITDGTIDSVYHYAWSENTGWIDFGAANSNIQVTDSGLSGYAYGENVGWINLGTVANTSSGFLSGYAWGENIGWVDFSNVTIGSDGVFAGQAYGENIGWITFGTGNNKVVTDWRPSSARPVAVVAPIRQTSGSRVVQSVVKQNVQVSPRSPFAQPLHFGLTNPSVKSLQAFLNTHGFTIATSGVGSPGHETNYFGNLTRQALGRFQLQNRLVTSPNDAAFGFLGPKTRALINRIK